MNTVSADPAAIGSGVDSQDIAPLTRAGQRVSTPLLCSALPSQKYANNKPQRAAAAAKRKASQRQL